MVVELEVDVTSPTPHYEQIRGQIGDGRLGHPPARHPVHPLAGILRRGDKLKRLEFSRELDQAGELRGELARLLQEARAAG